VEYIRGHEMGGGIGGILYSNRGGSLSFDHYNIRGDVVATTEASGSKTWQGWYDAFGTHAHEKGSAPQDRQRANTKEEDPTGLLNEGFRYRDLETGVFITRDPIGNTLMMPKEKWMVDGREVSLQEYFAALEPGVPQAGNGLSKSAKDSGAEADYHASVQSGERDAAPGQKGHFHTAAAGFPNLYTYVNENPWTFFDPEGLDTFLIVRDGHVGLAVDTRAGTVARMDFSRQGFAGTTGNDTMHQLKDAWTNLSGKGHVDVTVHSNLNDAVGKTPADVYRIKQTPEQDSKVLGAMISKKHNTPDYNLLHNNCGDQAVDALKAGGALNKYPHGIQPKGFSETAKKNKQITQVRKPSPPPPPPKDN
jgi:uncharacterized protein RhaS with RHS repeats